jgi:hypothetical protein
MTKLRRAATIALTSALLFAPAACSDEDGDGATTDEEQGEIDDTLDDAGEELEQEVDEGQEETD